jgi:hypothetical protein
VNLTADFAGAAQLGQWLEARADIQKATGSLASANCYVTADGQRIVRASGIFKAPNAPRAAAGPGPSAVRGG